MKQVVKISIDKSRSHIQGLLPFVRYNDDDSIPQFVSPSDANGNWGNFPYDIARVKNEVKRGEGVFYALSYSTGIKPVNENARLRYCDIILRYNRIQEQLRNGIKTKSVKKLVDDEESKIIGKQIGGNNCEYQISERDKEEELLLTTKFLEAKTKYEFKPMPASDFIKVGDNLYKPKEGISVDENEFIILIEDYEPFLNANEWWTSWWSYWGGDGLKWKEYFYVENSDFWFCKLVEKYFIGKVLVPEVYNGEEIMGIRVPDYVYYCEVNSLIDWFDKRLGVKKEKVKKEVEEHGGLPFYKFLKSLANEAVWISSTLIDGGNREFSYVAPYVSFTTTLEDEHEFSGVYESYLDGEEAFDEEKYKEDNGFEEIKRWAENTGIFVESKLANVMDESATEVEGITGVWGEFPGGAGLFECVYHNGTSNMGSDRTVVVNGGYWACTKINDTIPCGDGEAIVSGQRKYRTVTILDCIKNVVTAATNGNRLYFLAKKDNGIMSGNRIIPFDIPYTPKTIHNFKSTDESGVTGIGDIVKSVETNGGVFKIVYVIGAFLTKGVGYSTEDGNNYKYVEHTGTEYTEEYPYKENQIKVACIDGYDNVNVYYNNIDMEGSKSSVYIEDYGLYRRANRAEITGMEVGTMFTPEKMIMAKTFTKEGSNSFMEDPKKIFDITFNRGAAAAFESHFKLSECNTFEDLKNYGNNHFNL